MELPVTEPAETTIEEPAGSLERIEQASTAESLKEIAAALPDCLTAWAALGDRALASNDAVMAYAYYRVGYHRGLDRIRRAGWRGSGRVPWAHQPNRGFLRCLRGLGHAAEVIGETHEATRCADFFAQLAPDAPAA